MKNPKIYFKIKDGILVPYETKIEAIEVLFDSNFIKQNNYKNYNTFTKNFIKTGNNNEIYFSENYSYDPTKHTFNFEEIYVASEKELKNISKFKTKFDIKKSYTAFKKENIYDENSDNVNIISDNQNNSETFLQNIKNKYKIPSIKECGMYIDNFTWNYLVRNILKHQNTILVGPTGTGKTELVMAIAKILNMDCFVYDMGSMQDPLTDLLGSHRLENGNSIFDYSAFSEKIQKPCIIVLDELSRAPLMANNILFPCLDSRRELPIEIADSKSARNIKVHPECVFIATANIGAEYSGTNDIDAALFNRFLPLQLNYMGEKNEIDVLINRTGINKPMAQKIVNFANKIRKNYNDEIISKSCSTRETIAIANLVADGFTLSDSITAVILNKYHNFNDPERTIINRIMVSL